MRLLPHRGQRGRRRGSREGRVRDRGRPAARRLSFVILQTPVTVIIGRGAAGWARSTRRRSGRRRGARGARAASTARSARSPSRPPRRCCPSSAAPSTSGRRRANGRPGAFASSRSRPSAARGSSASPNRASTTSRKKSQCQNGGEWTVTNDSRIGSPVASARKSRCSRKSLGGAFGGLPRPVSPVAAQYSCSPHIGGSDSLKDER